MIDVRYATLRDKNEFLQLYQACSYAGSSEVRPCNKINDVEYKELVENESILLLCSSGSSVGYAIVHGFDDCGILTAKIEEVFIAQMFQRKGLGRNFVSEIKKIAKNEGFDRLEIFSASMETDMFWTGCGFKSINATDIYEFRLSN